MQNWMQQIKQTYVNMINAKFVKEEAALDGPNAALHPDIVKELIRQGYHHAVHNPIKQPSSSSGRGYFVQENPSMDSRSFPDARIVDEKTGRITLHPSYEGWTRLSGPYSGD